MTHGSPPRMKWVVAVPATNSMIRERDRNEMVLLTVRPWWARGGEKVSIRSIWPGQRPRGDREGPVLLGPTGPVPV